VHIVVIGHIDHGKSTTIGRLLYDSETLPESKVSEVQKLIEEYKRRFEFGYFLDAFQEELEEERTIDTTRVVFQGRKTHTIVDVPGHKEFIKNMLTGACNAEAAVLIVDVTKGVEEQTKRHAFLVKMLGIKDIVVCINKMDLVSYESLPFEECCQEVEDLLGKEFFYAIPTSALNGDNIYKKSSKMDWWTSGTLIEHLDSIETKRKTRDELLIQVQGTYKGYTFAKLLSGGTLDRRDVIFQPSGSKVTVDPIPAFLGTLLELKSKDGTILKRGEVGGVDLKVSSLINTETVLLEGRLKKGDYLDFCLGTSKVVCQVLGISEVIDPGTGRKLAESTSNLRKDQAGRVTLNISPIVTKSFSDLPELGRFVLERKGRQIGLGIVL
jgi:small GTP-binding protein